MKQPDNLDEARLIQRRLQKQVRIIPLSKPPRIVAGVDSAFTKNQIVSVVSLFTFPELLHITDKYHIAEIPFPYISGYLSFREGPSIIRAMKKLSVRPDVVIFDGQGIAHPYSMGIASHVGVLINIPSIGCAKSRLVGDYIEPGILKGQHMDLVLNDKIIGSVLRTRNNVKPLFISPGHLIDREASIHIVLNCADRYRLPVPIRRADALSKEIRKKLKG